MEFTPRTIEAAIAIFEVLEEKQCTKPEIEKTFRYAWEKLDELMTLPKIDYHAKNERDLKYWSEKEREKEREGIY